MVHYLYYLNKLNQEVMKTMKMNMVSLFWIIGLFCISLNGSSQDQKLNRQGKKEVRKALMQENFNILDSLLNVKSFVLEADFLVDKYGYRVPVLSDVNFVKVDESRGVLQTGSGTSMGYNGVGGVTTEGNVGGWKVYKDLKHLSYRVQFNLITNLGIYDIFMSVNSENNAMATITGLGPGKLSWEGHLATPGNSRVFKGLDTY
jgi:Domain of unknown function (DUF4251)